MSFEVMAWAVDQELACKEKMVLLMLANRTNKDTGRCDPSHKRLAFDCGMSESSVKRAISDLSEKGLLAIEQRRIGDVNLPNQYVINWRGVGSQGTHLGSHRPEGVGSHRPTNQEDNKQENNQPCPQQAENVHQFRFAEIQEAYNRICSPTLPSCRAASARRRRQVKVMVDLEFNGKRPFREHGLGMWESYFRDCLTNKHWVGDNDRGWRADFDFVTKPDNAIKLLERICG